jgi:hypothetical protein
MCTATGQPEWKNKAEEYLRSFADPTSESLNIEAVVFFLSRGNQCEDSIEKIIREWRAEIQKSKDVYHPSIWRLMDWANTVELQGYLDKQLIYRRFKAALHCHLRCVDFYAPLFLFRSDYGLRFIERKLDIMLIDLEDYIFPSHFRTHSGEPIHNEHDKIFACASLVFACERYPSNNIPKESIETAVKYLIDSQKAEGNWYQANNNLKARSILITAAAIHALALANPNGVERMLKRGHKWLLSQQNPDGSWSNTENWSPVYSTVFVLDALELAEGGKQVTFKVTEQEPTVEKNGVSKQGSTHHISPQTVNIQVTHAELEDALSKVGSQGLLKKDKAEKISESEKKAIKDRVNIEIMRIYQAVEQAPNS